MYNNTVLRIRHRSYYVTTVLLLFWSASSWFSDLSNFVNICKLYCPRTVAVQRFPLVSPSQLSNNNHPRIHRRNRPGTLVDVSQISIQTLCELLFREIGFESRSRKGVSDFARVYSRRLTPFALKLSRLMFCKLPKTFLTVRIRRLRFSVGYSPKLSRAYVPLLSCFPSPASFRKQ